MTGLIKMNENLKEGATLERPGNPCEFNRLPEEMMAHSEARIGLGHK